VNGQAYVGSSKRTFAAALSNLLDKDYGLVGSARVRRMMVEDVVALIEQFYPPAERVQPGWLVFTGTKGSGKKAYPGQEGGDHELVTIAWPVLLPEDVVALSAMPAGGLGKKELRRLLVRRLVRLVEHGLNHELGPVLLTHADLSLMLGISTYQVCHLLKQAREDTGKTLMTKGYYFDQGMRPTHKGQIIALYETGVDEADIAKRTQHSPQSVGRYIRDFNKVKMLVEREIEPEEMAGLASMTKGVVKAHLQLLQKHCPDLFEEKGSKVSSSI